VTTYEAAFQAWAEEVAAAARAAKPHIRPFPVEAFDGCTMAPDVCRHCCLVHDISYWFAETHLERRAADRAFRACVAGMGLHDERLWRLTWRLRAWRWWLAVRLFGGGIVSRRRAAWERAR
jgi:hypothetical protein